LIQGRSNKQLYFERYNLDMSVNLCDHLRLEYLNRGYADINTLEEAYDLLIKFATQMPTITTHGSIEYILQSDTTWKQRKEFKRDETQLKQLLIDKLEPYWMGEREPVGVDIEDAYKCGMCDYVDICSWREEKAKEISRKKQRLN